MRLPLVAHQTFMHCDKRGAMPRNLVFLTIFLSVLLSLPACTESAALNAVEAKQLAQEIQEGTVVSNLQLLLTFADRLAPIAQARNFDEVLQFASLAGCTLTSPDGPAASYSLLCHDVYTGAEVIALYALIQFRADGTPVEDPSQADTLWIYVESHGDFSLSEGWMECRPDPELGLVIDGTLTTRFDDETTVETSFGGLTAQLVADLPGLAWGVVFTSGNVDLSVHTPGGPTAQGSAALVGRRAAIAVAVDGVFHHAEIDLD
ncbi:MAG: hypothetical protein ACYTGV_02525 [Planctomycetota bacterium]|jgi:hypothetical protein